MKTAILANGQIDDLGQLLPSIQRHDRIVVVDGGLFHCKQGGLSPDFLIGDWDSCPPELLDDYSLVPKKTLQRDKDLTDLEAALEEEWKRGALSITLFGAWGKRVDHSLTNALILGRYPAKLRMETETEVLFAIQGSAQLQCYIGQTVSFIPLFGPATGIYTSGFKWELQNGTFDRNFIGVSNVCQQNYPEIHIQNGILLCCQLK